MHKIIIVILPFTKANKTITTPYAYLLITVCNLQIEKEKVRLDYELINRNSEQGQHTKLM